MKNDSNPIQRVGLVILSSRDVSDGEAFEVFFHCFYCFQILDELGLLSFGFLFNMICDDLRVCLDDAILVPQCLHLAKPQQESFVFGGVVCGYD